MVPGLWLNEGGQSAAGAAIDQLLSFHPAAAEARELSKRAGVPLPVLLPDMAARKAGRSSDAVTLAAGLHVVPEFLGNRAPFVDPHARAIIAGLGMEDDIGSLVSLYVAGLCGIGYGLRQIIETQADADVTIEMSSSAAAPASTISFASCSPMRAASRSSRQRLRNRYSWGPPSWARSPAGCL